MSATRGRRTAGPALQAALTVTALIMPGLLLGVLASHLLLLLLNS